MMLWPDIIQFGRVTSDVIRGMGVTPFIAVRHIAIKGKRGLNNGKGGWGEMVGQGKGRWGGGVRKGGGLFSKFRR